MAKGADSGDSEDFELSNPAYTLPRFNTLHNLAREQIRYNDRDSAKQTYERMVALYDEINKSRLNPDDKQRAYGKLMYVFTALTSDDSFEPSPGIVGLGKYLFPISLVVIVLLIIFFLRPEFSLTGLAVADTNSAPQWTAGNANFLVKGATEINLDTFFSDPDGDRISYAVGGAPNLDINLQGSKLTITPDLLIKGLRVLSITASDGRASSRAVAVVEII